MRQIAKNPYYELVYDQANSVVYMKFKGFWKDMSVVPNFENDWYKVLEIASKPFKIYGDLTQSKPQPEEVKKANDEMQQYLLQNGCEKVACIVDSALTKLSTNSSLKQSNMLSVTQFFTSDEAEAAENWLKS